MNYSSDGEQACWKGPWVFAKSGSWSIVCIQSVCETCPLCGVVGCLLFRGCLIIKVNGRTVGTFRIVRYIVGICCWGVSIKWDSAVLSETLTSSLTEQCYWKYCHHQYLSVCILCTSFPLVPPFCNYCVWMDWPTFFHLRRKRRSWCCLHASFYRPCSAESKATFWRQEQWRGKWLGTFHILTKNPKQYTSDQKNNLVLRKKKEEKNNLAP